jgi:hypothetical protein
MPTRLCEKCDVEIALTQPNSWYIHQMSKTHLENKPHSSRKLCEKCNLEIKGRSWSNHLKSKKKKIWKTIQIKLPN